MVHERAQHVFIKGLNIGLLLLWDNLVQGRRGLGVALHSEAIP